MRPPPTFSGGTISLVSQWCSDGEAKLAVRCLSVILTSVTLFIPRHISLVVACGLQLHPYVDSHSPLGVHFFPVTLKCFFFILSSFCGWLRLRR